MKQISANITGSLIINGVDVTDTLGSSSFWSGSFSTRVSNLESFSGSINSYTASNNTNISNLNATTASLNSYTASNDINIGNINSTTASLNLASGSAITRLNALESASGSAITRLNSIELTTGSLNAASGSAITRLNALEVTSGSNITRISALELASGSAISRLNSIESKTGSYATTGSNTFVDTQYVSASNNAVGFTSTASFYTDGGLRVAKDAYISGTLYLNNVTVYGTQSVCFITSSQLNISSNLISVNTSTPSVRFGGLAVYDSGSTGLTGSLLWDSENNHWVYSNPSGSSYSGGMFISGPRTATLGSEVGTTSCALMMGQGGDHITSSAIFHYGNATCFYENTIVSSSGHICTSTAAFTSCASVGTAVQCSTFTVKGPFSGGYYPSSATKVPLANFVGDNPELLISDYSNGTGRTATLRLGTTDVDYYCYGAYVRAIQGSGVDSYSLAFGTSVNNPSTTKLVINGAGVSCFAGTVCAPTFIGSNASLAADFCYTSTGDVSFNSKDAFAKAKFTGVESSAQLGLFRSGESAGGVYIGGNGNQFSMYKADFSCMLMSVSQTGVACFLSTVCTPQGIFSNCVGIGLSQPREALHVKGLVLFDKTSGAAEPNIRLRTTTDSCAVEWGIGTPPNSCDFAIREATGEGWIERMRINYNGVTTFNCQVCVTNNIVVTGPGIFINRPASSSGEPYLFWQKDGVTRGSIYGANNADGLRYFGASHCFESIVCAPIHSATTRVLINSTCPCSMLMSIGGYGTTWGGNSCYYGGGLSGGGFPYGDEYGNGASYTYQTANTTQNSIELRGGFSGGYFRGGNGGGYGGGGAGIVAIGGNGANAESVNSGGGAGIFARGGLNGACSALAYAAWFDGGDVIVRCGKVGIGCSTPTYHLEVRCAASTSSCYLAAMFARSTGASDGVGDIIAFGANGVSSIAGIYRASAGSWGLELQTANQNTRMRIDNNGITTFCCTVCAPNFKFSTYGSTQSFVTSLGALTAKTITICTDGGGVLNGALQVTVGLYVNGAGGNSVASWIVGGYMGAGAMRIVEVARSSDTYGCIGIITNPANCLIFTIGNCFGFNSMDVSVMVTSVNANISALKIYCGA